MKKKIPLQVLEFIEPFVDRKGKTFDTINSDNFLLKFIDKEEGSNFYFNVESYKIENGFNLLIDWKPDNKQTIANHRTWIKAENLETYFSNWLKLLEGYEKVKTVFDDPILNAFTEEYFSDFEIVEDDADSKPFSSKQIMLLDVHLENIQKKIGKYENPENNFEIQEIKNDVIELRYNLTKKSKEWVIKRLAKVWAKITKQGPILMKEFLSETKKNAIKEGVKFIFEHGIDLIK